MRKSAIVCAVLGLFLGSLLLASAAEARAGGGGSGGSRGSRSFSAPRSPSTPGSPASPTTPQRNLTPQPGPQRPGGLFGGLGGMLGGLLLGGLLGSLLFGGLGRGFGIGLMDILLVAGLAYLAYAFFRRRNPQPALASAPAGASRGSAVGWAPAATTEPAAPAGGVALVDDDLERGLAAIRTMDSAFDARRFADGARHTFVRVQGAWSAGDLSPVRAELTDEMAATFDADLRRLATRRRVNRVEKLSVEAAEVTEAWQEYGQDFVTVHFRASGLDYTLDETTGAVVEGSNVTPVTFEEYWTFTRPVGPNAWRLTAIQQPST